MKLIKFGLLGILLFGFQTHAPAQEKGAVTIVNGIITKWRSIQDYQCLMRSKNRLGELTDSKKLKFSYKKSKQVRVEVLDGEKKGSVLTRDANGTIKAKKGGLLGVIALTLDEDDERIRNLRGRKFYHATWGAVIKEFHSAVEKQRNVQRLPDEEFNKHDCYVLSIEGGDPKDRITKDISQGRVQGIHP